MKCLSINLDLLINKNNAQHCDRGKNIKKFGPNEKSANYFKNFYQK